MRLDDVSLNVNEMLCDAKFITVWMNWEPKTSIWKCLVSVKIWSEKSLKNEEACFQEVKQGIVELFFILLFFRNVIL